MSGAIVQLPPAGIRVINPPLKCRSETSAIVGTRRTERVHSLPYLRFKSPSVDYTIDIFSYAFLTTVIIAGSGNR